MAVYDYSFARPDPATLDEGVIRYLCSGPQNGKRLESVELARLHAAGKPVGLVWENNTSDSDGGYQTGARYGVLARAAANMLGFPADHPIYWAVDKRLNAATRATALEYGRGFRDAAGWSRPYGEGALIEAAVDAGIADCGWMPETWGRSDHLALVQRVGVSDVPNTDMNTVMRPDWGGWHPDQGDDMPLTADDVKAIWAILVTDFTSGGQQSASAALSYARNDAHAATEAVAALTAKVAVLEAAIAKIGTASTGGSVDVKSAVKDALREGTGG